MIDQQKIAGIVINEEGMQTAQLIARRLAGFQIHRLMHGMSLSGLAESLFNTVEGLIFFCAVGIAVRMIGPHIRDNHTDPAVVVVDNGARFAISLLSGHEGGANLLAVKIACIIGARPVITTATEARKQYVIGLGSRKAIPAQAVVRAIIKVSARYAVPLESVRTVATIGRKYDEPGIQAACGELGLSLERITEEQIKTFALAFKPTAAAHHLGIPAVAEPCALLAAREGRLIAGTQAFEGVTIAIAKERVGTNG